MLHPPTAEQRHVVDLLLRGKNVKVCAVAGSGKSTTVLHCLRGLIKDPSMGLHQRALVLSYSRGLRLDTEDRIARLELSEMADVRTLNALARSLYGDEYWNDFGMEQILKKDLPLLQRPDPHRSYDIIFIDEAQDITPTLCDFLLKAVRDLLRAGIFKSLPIWGVFGDVRQTVFRYKLSDPRYLTLCDRLLPSHREWLDATLQQSFRLTLAMAELINKGIRRPGGMGETAILSSPGRALGRKVQYYLGSEFKTLLTLAKMLVKRLCSGELKPDDILIISPSTKVNITGDALTPLNRLSNYISDKNNTGGKFFPQLVKKDDAGGEDSLGKILLSTRHASKGLERYLVIVTGLSNNYYHTIGKDEDTYFCSEPFFVALTRSFGELHITGEAREGDRMSWLDLDSAKDFVDVVGVHELPKSKVSAERNSSWTVTKLISQVTSRVLLAADALIAPLWRRIAPPGENLSITSEVSTPFDGTGRVWSYGVSHFTGIAIPTMLHLGEGAADTWPHTKGDFPFVLTFAQLEHWLHGKRIERQCLDGNENLEDFESLMKEVVKLQEYKKGLEDAHAAAVKELKGEGGGGGPLFDYPAEFYLRCAGLWYTAASINAGYNFQYLDIPRWDWLSEGMAQRCKERLRAGVEGWDEPTTVVNEVLLYSYNNGEWSVEGELDVSTPTAVYELKVTETLTLEYKIQLALYAYLWLMCGRKGLGGMKAFRLLNIKSGECLELVLTDDNGEVVGSAMSALKACLHLLVDNKLASSPPVPEDEDFLAQHKEGVADVIRAATDRGIVGVSVTVKAEAGVEAEAEAEVEGEEKGEENETQTATSVDHTSLPPCPPSSPLMAPLLSSSPGQGGAGVVKRPREEEGDNP